MRRLSLPLLGAVVLMAVACACGRQVSVSPSVQSPAATAPPAGKIVFTRAGNLYVMAPDGSHVRLLARKAADAAVSRDGRRIAFVRDEAIWVMGRSGTGQKALTDSGSSSDSQPAWSVDGNTVFFSRWTTRIQTSSIFSIRKNGTGLHRLTSIEPGSEGACSDHPAPSPDGRLVAYAYAELYDCQHGVGLEIAGVTITGRPASLPFRFPGALLSVSSAYDPAWAPGGQLLAYAFMDLDAAEAPTPTADTSGIYVSSADGSRARRVATGGYVKAPAWSRDQRWIAYVGNGDVWTVRADGTQPRSLTGTAADEGDPAWLPPLR